PAAAAAAPASACTWTPKSRASASRSASTGSATCSDVAATPRATMPPTRLRAMLPPPMKAVADGSGVGRVMAALLGGTGRPLWPTAPCAPGRRRAGPAQGRAHADHGRALGDGQREVRAHAHRQGVGGGVRSAQARVQLAQAGEGLAAPPEV